MTRVLLVEDHPDLGLYEAHLLRARGFDVTPCSGAPSALRSCPMLTEGACALVDGADVIVFAASTGMPLPGHPYRGKHLFAAYRAHPLYRQIPMVVVGFGPPPKPDDGGPLVSVRKFSEPAAVVAAVEHALWLGRARATPRAGTRTRTSGSGARAGSGRSRARRRATVMQKIP